MNEFSQDPAYVVHWFILVPVPADRKRSPTTLFQGVMRTQTANLVDAYLVGSGKVLALGHPYWDMPMYELVCFLLFLVLPSGKHAHNCGKSPCLMERHYFYGHIPIVMLIHQRGSPNRYCNMLDI